MGNVEKSGVLGGEACREEETRPWGLTALALSTTCGQPCLLHPPCGMTSFASLPRLLREADHGYRVEWDFQGTEDDL